MEEFENEIMLNSRKKKNVKGEELLHSIPGHDVQNKARVVKGCLELLDDTDLTQ